MLRGRRSARVMEMDGRASTADTHARKSAYSAPEGKSTFEKWGRYSFARSTKGYTAMSAAVKSLPRM